MTNVHFDLEDYEDIEVRNAYRELVVKEKSISEEAFCRAVWNKSRDNARTPMQWDDTENAGFTDGTPWFRLNDRYREINVKRALDNPDSIFYYYQKLIRLRHEEPLLTEGRYELLLENDPHIFAYLRRSDKETWLIAANLSEETLSMDGLKSYAGGEPEFLISNYGRDGMGGSFRPYEAFMARVH